MIIILSCLYFACWNKKKLSSCLVFTLLVEIRKLSSCLVFTLLVEIKNLMIIILFCLYFACWNKKLNDYHLVLSLLCLLKKKLSSCLVFTLLGEIKNLMIIILFCLYFACWNETKLLKRGKYWHWRVVLHIMFCFGWKSAEKLFSKVDHFLTVLTLMSTTSP